jgi:DNA invertase Pin-like site-specific DNA recombinase
MIAPSSLRVAAYSRVSTDEQAKRFTPSTDQLVAARKLCTDRGWTVVMEDSDDGISGSIWPRRGLASILAAALRGEIDAVVLWDWSRLCREDENETPGLAGHLRWLFAHDARVKLVSVTEDGEPPLMRDVRLAVGAEMRRTTAAASRRGIASRVSRRLRMGGPALHGYRWTADDQVEIVEDEAAVIRLAYQLADPESPRMSLNEIGRRIGRDRAVVRYWLRNPFYGGAYFHRRFRAVRCKENPRRHWAQRLELPATIEWGHHAPIVDPDQWHRVQCRLDDHRDRTMGRHPGRETLALSGLLHCGDCGSRLARRYVRPLASGGKRTCYRCTGGCPGSYTLDDGPQQIGAMVAGELARPELAAILAHAHGDAHEREREGLEALQAEITRQTRIVGQLEAAVASDIVPDPTGLLARLASAQRARATAQEALRRTIQHQADHRHGTTPETLQAWIHELAEGVSRAASSPDLEAALRPLLRLLCDRVELWPESPRVRVSLESRALLDRNQSGIQWSSCSRLVAIEGEVQAAGRRNRQRSQ